MARRQPVGPEGGHRHGQCLRKCGDSSRRRRHPAGSSHPGHRDHRWWRRRHPTGRPVPATLMGGGGGGATPPGPGLPPAAGGGGGGGATPPGAPIPGTLVGGDGGGATPPGPPVPAIPVGAGGGAATPPGPALPPTAAGGGGGAATPPGPAAAAFTDSLPQPLADALPTISSGASQVVGSPPLGKGPGAAGAPGHIPTPQDMVCGDPGWSVSIGDLDAGPLIAAIPGMSTPKPEPPRRDRW